MLQTFANLPLKINEAISNLLSRQETTEWISRAEKLHSSYMTREKDGEGNYINDFQDVLAYLGLRIPSTYAQIFGVLSQVQEIIPSWEPKSLLDIGSGPGTGIWATKEIWPSIETATCIDKEKYFLSVGEELTNKALEKVKTTWKQEDITQLKVNSAQFDLVIIANVLNELSDSQQKILLGQAYNHSSGIIVIIEPGTSYGVNIIRKTAQTLIDKGNLLAPYINNSFVDDSQEWIHFPQRFIRPDFLRRIRQQMRTSSLMASDWEETKYAYVAVGKIPPEEEVWGRVIGPIKKQKGFLEVSTLTKDEIEVVRVLKRHKKEYSFAKNLQWGQIIRDSSNVIA
ncbi:MAG: methyltransferase domain-containing protein [Armatimonadetes bacterium]|nr:MAG: methyltransferase domain-containing protein [Armatimonadota bacterium]